MGLRKYRSPASVHLVLEFLRQQDDLFTVKMIAAGTNVTVARVSAAVYMLRDYHCAAPVVDNMGRVWWYALPIEEDTRVRTVPERVEESKPRKRRVYLKKKVKIT